MTELKVDKSKIEKYYLGKGSELIFSFSICRFKLWKKIKKKNYN